MNGLGFVGDWARLLLNHWILSVFLIVLATVVVNFVVRLLLKRLQNKLLQNHTLWDDAVLQAIGKPLRVLIWIVGLYLAVDAIDSQSKRDFLGDIEPVRNLGVVCCVLWFVLRLIKIIEASVIQERMAADADFDRTTVIAISKLLRMALLITAVLVILQTIGVSVSGVLAFGGVGGIAIGFAARDLLANFFGGLMVYLDRPFSVGDWVRSPDREIEGTVEDIGWRQTRIRTFDKRPLYVPNSVFANIVVENPSRMSNRRIQTHVGIRYQDIGKMAAIVHDVKTMLEQHPDIDQKQTLIVNFDVFNAHSLDMLIYTFTKTTNWVLYHQIRQQVLLAIVDIIQKHGAQLALPTQSLQIESREFLPPPERA